MYSYLHPRPKAVLLTAHDTIVYYTIELDGEKLHAKVIDFQHRTINSTDASNSR